MESEPLAGDDGEPTLEVTQRILREAASGDRTRVEELYARVAPAVYAWAHLRMSPAMRRRIDPQDVVQEVWLRALQRLDEFDPASVRFRAWILGVARFVLIEFSRKHLDPRSRGSDSLIDGRADSATGVSTAMIRRDAVSTFLELVERQGEDDRELLILRGLEGRPFDEVAERMGLSKEATTKRWQRLRARFSADGPPSYLL